MHDTVESALAAKLASDWSVASRSSSGAASFSFACRIAAAIIGAATFEKPDGSPRLRSVMRVPPPAVSVHS